MPDYLLKIGNFDNSGIKYQQGSVVPLTEVELKDSGIQELIRVGVFQLVTPTTEVLPILEALTEVAPVEASETNGRFNINIATAEEIAEAINGIGLKTAKMIVELRESLPESKFTELDQLRSISRVDWNAVIPQLSLE